MLCFYLARKFRLCKAHYLTTQRCKLQLIKFFKMRRRGRSPCNFLICCIFLFWDGAMTFFQLAILSTRHFRNLTFFQAAILWACHFDNLPFHQLDIFSAWCFFNLTFHKLVISSTFHFVYLPIYQFTIYSSQLVISSTFHYWTFHQLAYQT